MKLTDLIDRALPATPWEEGDNIPWNDPTFSERMLTEHLQQNSDAASRRFEKIDAQVRWIHDVLLAEQRTRVLDLACGSGLYTSRLARLGHAWTKAGSARLVEVGTPLVLAQTLDLLAVRLHPTAPLVEGHVGRRPPGVHAAGQWLVRSLPGEMKSPCRPMIGYRVAIARSAAQPVRKPQCVIRTPRRPSSRRAPAPRATANRYRPGRRVPERPGTSRGRQRGRRATP